MSAGVADSTWFWVLLLGTLAVGYVLPIVIAVLRRVEDIALVVIFNLIPMGWPAALLLACTLPRRRPVTRTRRTPDLQRLLSPGVRKDRVCGPRGTQESPREQP